MGQACDVIHNGARDAIGVIGGIRGDVQRHQVGAVDYLSGGRGIKGGHTKVLADLLFQQTAVENVGETVRHGIGRVQVGVGVVAVIL